MTHNLIPDHPLRLAGKDVTSVFFQLHRVDVLEKPAYKRLVIGTIEGQTAQFTPPKAGTISLVPYAVRSQSSERILLFLTFTSRSLLGSILTLFLRTTTTYVLYPDLEDGRHINVSTFQSHRRFQKALRVFVDDVSNVASANHLSAHLRLASMSSRTRDYMRTMGNRQLRASSTRWGMFDWVFGHIDLR